MNKIGALLIYFLIAHASTLFAQKPASFFDANFKKVDFLTQAKYAVYLDTAPIKTVYYLDPPKRVLAKGVIYPSDILTFDGEVFFEGRGNYQAVRYYQKGVVIPVILTDENLRKMPTGKATCYLVMDEYNHFRGYKMGFKMPDMSVDKLFCIGQVTDTTSLHLTGLFTVIDDNGYSISTKKYNNGLELPFLESTIDTKNFGEVFKVLIIRKLYL